MTYRYTTYVKTLENEEKKETTTNIASTNFENDNWKESKREKSNISIIVLIKYQFVDTKS